METRSARGAGLAVSSRLPFQMIGTQVSHYSIIRALGSGGMGIVYEAEDA